MFYWEKKKKGSKKKKKERKQTCMIIFVSVSHCGRNPYDNNLRCADLSSPVYSIQVAWKELYAIRGSIVYPLSQLSHTTTTNTLFITIHVQPHVSACFFQKSPLQHTFWKKLLFIVKPRLIEHYLYYTWHNIITVMPMGLYNSNWVDACR